MESPRPHRFEDERLDTLRELKLPDVSDSGIDTLVGDLTRQAGMPVCLFSVVGEDQQYFPARTGIEVSALPRASSFCGHAINADEVIFTVEDALEDPRFADNPLVIGDPHIRFYAGVKINAPNGLPVGALCLIDRKPRELDAASRAALLDGKQVLERWLQNRWNKR